MATDKLVPITREQLEEVAARLGPESASARALAEAGRHDGPVEFYRIGEQILVRKLAEGPDPDDPVDEAERARVRAEVRARGRGSRSRE